MVRIARSKALNFLLALFFYLMLTMSFFMAVRHLYVFKLAGYSYQFDYVNFTVSTIFITITTFLLNIMKLKGFAYLTLSIQLIIFLIPSSVIFTGLEGVSPKVFASHLIMFYLTLGMCSIRFDKIRPTSLTIKSTYALLLIIVCIGMIPFLVVYTPYINLRNLYFEEIYETRLLMSEKANFGLTNYTYSWLNKFIIPCLIIISIYTKHWKTVGLGLIFTVFLYLCGAHKTVIATLLVILFLYKWTYLEKAKYFLIAIIIILTISLSGIYFFRNDLIMVHTIRRVLMLPALVDWMYFQFFENNFLYWSEHFDGLIIDYPYSISHPYIIGKEYFGFEEWGANNGFVSDGYMNGGMFGVIINSFVFSIFISLFNHLDIDSRFYGLFFIFLFLCLSSSMLTVVVSHGGLVLLAMSYFLLNRTEYKMT